METIFETERLLARQWTTSEADVAAAFAIYGNAEVARFIREAPEENLETQQATLERILARYEAMGNGFGFWAIVEKESGKTVGSIMLKPLPGYEEIEVGWHLSREVWGLGYATEMAKACLHYGFETVRLKRIVAVVNPRNERSLAVARRLEMRPEGQIRAYDLDLELFALERDA